MDPRHHLPHLLRTVELARQARTKGNHPFGSLLVDPATGEVVCEAENTVVTDNDCTGHAETNLVREALRIVPQPVLKRRCRAARGCGVTSATQATGSF